MIVYTVEERIDLGNQVISVHFKKEDAEKLVAENNVKHSEKYGASGVTVFFELGEYEVQ